MTITEAYQEMEKGNKVRHRYFSDDEFLHMVNGIITSEEGYNFEEWFEGGEVWKQDGWSIIN